MTNRATDLKQEIKEKFKNASRFSMLSGIPYSYLHNAFTKKNKDAALDLIKKKIGDTDNRATFDEVSIELIQKVEKALKGKSLNLWCQTNGVPHWWLMSFLRGRVRFKNHHRVTRLLDLLKIND